MPVVLQVSVPVKVPTVEPVKVTLTVLGTPMAKTEDTGLTTKPLLPVIPQVNVVPAPAVVNTKPRLDEPVGRL